MPRMLEQEGEVSLLLLARAARLAMSSREAARSSRNVRREAICW